MLLNGGAERNDAVSGDQSRQHEQRQRWDEHDLASSFDAIERERENDPSERHEFRCAQVVGSFNECRIDVVECIKNRQNHKRYENVHRNEHEAEIGK